MAFKFLDRTKETTATVGAGNLTFGGAVSSYGAFSAGLANGDTTPYVIVDGADWEEGVLTYISASNSASRAVSKSTNANAAIALSGAASITATLRASDVGASAGNLVQLNSSAQLPPVDGSLLTGLLPPRGQLAGLTLSTAGSSSSFAVAAGTATSDDATTLMSLAASITKTTSAWAVGTGNGSLDTGAIAASTWYHVFEIERTDTGVVDVLVSLSATAPTLPASYTKQRRIGAMKTDGSSKWTAFTQYGDKFLWLNRVVDANATATAADAAGHLITLTVPTGVVVEALFDARLDYSSGGGASLLFTSPAEADRASGASAASLIAVVGTTNAAGRFASITNTSAQVRERANGTVTTFSIETFGWVDRRGRDA